MKSHDPIIVEHPDAPLSTSMLAERVDMSEHTLTRRFRDETGMTPMEFVVSVRVGHARALLEQTDWPIDRIAAKSGFGPSDALQRAFARRLRSSPREYRRQHRGMEAAVK